MKDTFNSTMCTRILLKAETKTSLGIASLHSRRSSSSGLLFFALILEALQGLRWMNGLGTIGIETKLNVVKRKKFPYKLFVVYIVL